MPLFEYCEIPTLQLPSFIAERRFALVVHEYVIGETDLPTRLLRELAEIVLFAEPTAVSVFVEETGVPKHCIAYEHAEPYCRGNLRPLAHRAGRNEPVHLGGGKTRGNWIVLEDRKSTRLNSSHLGISYA